MRVDRAAEHRGRLSRDQSSRRRECARTAEREYAVGHGWVVANERRGHRNRFHFSQRHLSRRFLTHEIRVVNRRQQTADDARNGWRRHHVDLSAWVPPDEHAGEVLHEFCGHGLEAIRIIRYTRQASGGVIECHRRPKHGRRRLQCVHLVQRSENREHEVSVVYAVRHRRWE